MSKVSVIVAFNHKDWYLKRCVKSILNQTYENIECLLVENGSKYFSWQEVLGDKNLEDSDKLKFTQEVEGSLGEAKNRGIGESSGDYLLFLHPHDMLNPHAVETLLEYSKTHQSDITNGSFRVLEKGKKRLELSQGLLFSGETKTDFSCVSISSNLYKSSFLKKHSIEFAKEALADDLGFLIRSTYLAEKICCLPSYKKPLGLLFIDQKKPLKKIKKSLEKEILSYETLLKQVKEDLQTQTKKADLWVFMEVEKTLKFVAYKLQKAYFSLRELCEEDRFKQTLERLYKNLYRQFSYYMLPPVSLFELSLKRAIYRPLAFIIRLKKRLFKKQEGLEVKNIQGDVEKQKQLSKTKPLFKKVFGGLTVYRALYFAKKGVEFFSKNNLSTADTLSTEDYKTQNIYRSSSKKLLSIMQKEKKSETLFILLTSSNINQINAKQWDYIRQHDSLGVNQFLLFPHFKADYYSLDLGVWYSNPINAIKKNLMMNAFSKNKFESYFFINEAEMDVVTWAKACLFPIAQNSKGIQLIGSDAFLIFQEKDIQQILSKLSLKHLSLSWLIHYGASLIQDIFLGCLLGYKEIVITGSRLKDSLYFWDDSSLWSENPEYKTYHQSFSPSSYVKTLAHDTVLRKETSSSFLGVIEFIALIKEHVLERWGVKLWLDGNGDSLLESVVDFYPPFKNLK